MSISFDDIKQDVIIMKEQQLKSNEPIVNYDQVQLQIGDDPIKQLGYTHFLNEEERTRLLRKK